MGSYHGPKGRINRRLNSMVFEDNGAVKALENRPTPPGMHGRRRKVSTYGLALAEKQKIKYYYGLRERQLRRYFDMARRHKGNTGEHLLVICECRLDNVVRRAGFCVTRPQARQGVGHGHFQVNGRKVDIPSYLVKAGDVITLRNRPNLKKIYRDIVDASTLPHCDFVAFDSDGLRATVTSQPSFEDVSLHVDVGQVVAFLSR